MTADARADARGHAADERERTGSTALERRPAVVGHRWPSAAGPDEPVPAWQVVDADLRARHGLCAAWWRARARWALRWRRRRRRPRVGDARSRCLAVCSKCAVCVTVCAKNLSTPGFHVSECVCIRHTFDTYIHLTPTASTDRLTHVSEYHYMHQPKHVYEHVRRLRNAAARPGGYARSRSQACRSVPSLRPLPAHAAPTALRSSPSTGDRLPAVRAEKARQDGATHRREPQRAALSIATDAQTTRSIDGKQPPPNKHSLGVLAAPRAPHLHEHRTNTEALLRPPSTSMPRSCRTDRGGHRAESDVEETSARRKRSAESGSRDHGRGRDKRHG